MNKKIFNIIWVAKRNDGKDSFIGVAGSYDEINKIGAEDYEKTKTTHYLREYAEVSEGEILCTRNHCYKEHFNYCPHCGGKLLYSQDGVDDQSE